MSGGSEKDFHRRIRFYVPTLAVMLTLLLIFPFLNAEWSVGEAPAEVSPLRISNDPLDQLPDSPQDAHGRLEEKRVGWPIELEGDGSSPAAASVQAGLRISIPFDTVDGRTTSANAGVRVELIRGGPVIQTVDTSTDSSGWFYADLSAGNILSGDRVRVTDPPGVNPVEVDCTLTGAMDMNADIVSGSAPVASEVDVYIASPSTYYGDIPPGVAHNKVTAAGGSYSASFYGYRTQPGGAHSVVSTTFDIKRGDVAYIFSTVGGNSVMEVANTGGSLVVYPQYNEVMGFYLPSTLLTVNAGSASRTTTTSKDGFLDALFVDHDIVSGETVSCNMGVSRSIAVQDVSSTCDPYTNIVEGHAPPNRPMRITMNTYGQPVVVETASDASGAFSAYLKGAYDVSGIERYNVTWYNDAGDAVVYEFQTYSWFLPEGYTSRGFDEWVLVMNPTSETAKARVIFQTLTGPVEGPLINAPPNSRNTVHVNDWAPNQQVSTMVTAIDGLSIMAERAMYIYGDVGGKWGAHDSIGILAPSPVWYLPEGATYRGYDEWICIQNPNAVQVKAKVQFLGGGGIARETEVTIDPASRYTVHANDWVPNTEISTRVQCLTEENGLALPLFAERAMYIATADGKRGAHDSIGVSSSAPEWYLPEGATWPGFDEWVCIQNPNDFGTTVQVVFLTPQGVGGGHEFFMPPNSRGTVHVNDFISNNDISTVVRSKDGAGIMAERAMYISATGKRGAHDSIGAYSTSTYWFLPEGTTRPGFDEWVCIQNPNGVEARVRVSLLGPDGLVNRITFTMKPNSRYTVHVNEMVSNMDVSAVVESIGGNPVGILAERAMYIWSGTKQGAHDSIGVPSL